MSRPKRVKDPPYLVNRNAKGQLGLNAKASKYADKGDDDATGDPPAFSACC